MKYKESRNIQSKEEYLKLFSETGKKQKDSKCCDESKQSIALKNALDIRKFEIELYWKRGAYFWAFIAVTFTSYFIVLNTEISKIGFTLNFKDELIFSLNLFGLFLAVSWFFVNKGSKHWQENWEKHVDLLEDEIMGPLYKTTVSRDKFWDRFNPLKSYPYSVGKINQLISLSVVFLWLFLLLRFIIEKLDYSFRFFFSSYSFIGFAFLIFFFYLFLYTESSKTNGKELNMQKREIENKTKT